MKHFLFREKISGEEFLVGENSIEAAVIIATEVAETIALNYSEDEEYDLTFICELTEEEAEISAFDEY